MRNGSAPLYRCPLPVFRNAMDRCHALAKPYFEQGLLDVIFAQNNDDTLVNRTSLTQPALFAVEYALAAALAAFGVRPAVMIGHSLGEIVAATIAGGRLHPAGRGQDRCETRRAHG